MENRIMATIAELVTDLQAVRVVQLKTALEIQSVQAGVNLLNTKITELEAIIAAGNVVPAELVEAVAAVKLQAQVVDELIPDLAPPV